MVGISRKDPETYTIHFEIWKFGGKIALWYGVLLLCTDLRFKSRRHLGVLWELLWEAIMGSKCQLRNVYIHY
jgi:hypothetical protein